MPGYGQTDLYMWPSSEERAFLQDGRWVRIREKIDKGKEELQKAEVARENFETAQKADDVHAVRMRQLRERIYRHQLVASTYFEDAHRIQYKLLSDALKSASPSEFAQMKEDLIKQFQKGRVLRRRAVRSVPQNSPKSLVSEAASFESEALERLLTAALKNMGYAIPEKRTLIQKPLQVADTLFAGSLKEIPDTLKPESPPPVKNASPNIPDAGEDVFFSIQFLATRQPVSDERVKSVYNGSLPVIKHEGEGWYRFSAGKFSSVEEALEEKEREGIYGFIVAYRNRERISMDRARAYQ